MATWPKCLYGKPQDAAKPWGAVSLMVQQLHDQTAYMFDRRLDGSNISPSFAGGGLVMGPPTPVPPNGPPIPPKLTNPIGDDNTECYFKKKGTTFQSDATKPGMELAVNPADPSGNGKFCIVASINTGNPGGQLASIIPEDPETVTNPGAKFYAPTGKGMFGTSAAFDWELHRNGSASLSDDGTAIGTTRTLFRLGTLASSASFPALKRSSANLQVRLGDDSDYSQIQANHFAVNSGANSIGYLDTGGLEVPSNGRIGFSASTTVDDMDVGFSRAGDGKAILSAQDGANTSPMFLFNGAAATDAGLKRSSTRMQTRLGDDSAFAGHDASTIDLYGLATAFRHRIDPGTPTANKSATLPPVDGTLPVMTSITANALLKSSGTTGTTVPSNVSDDATSTITANRTFKSSHTLGLFVQGGDDGTNGRQTTTHGGDGASGNGNGAANTTRGGDALGSGTGGASTWRAGTSPTGTKGASNWQHADGTNRIGIDASGNTLFSGVQGTSGQLAAFTSTGSLTSSGLTSTIAGRYLASYVLTSGTTHTTGASTTKIKIRVQAGGGGGGGGASAAVSAAVGGGGSAGGYAEKTFTVAASTGYTYAIGAAGAAGANTGGNGGNGGDSTFQVGATTVTALGGIGGLGDTAGTVQAIFSGGVSPEPSTNGDVNSGGAPGSPAVRLTGLIGLSGNGGSCLFGAGGVGKSAQSAGAAGKGYGAGGSGACVLNGGAAAIGGAGLAGIIVVDEYS